MSQDQYFRADLNPNKEIIAQGRAPTTESTKLTNGMDTINLDIKKIESDYFTRHTTGVDRVYQEIPTDQPCEYTRDKDTLDNDKIAYRIEGDLLDPSNTIHIHIHCIFCLLILLLTYIYGFME